MMRYFCLLYYLLYCVRALHKSHRFHSLCSLPSHSHHPLSWLLLVRRFNRFLQLLKRFMKQKAPNPPYLILIHSARYLSNSYFLRPIELIARFACLIFVKGLVTKLIDPSRPLLLHRFISGHPGLNFAPLYISIPCISRTIPSKIEAPMSRNLGSSWFSSDFHGRQNSDSWTQSLYVAEPQSRYW